MLARNLISSPRDETADVKSYNVVHPGTGKTVGAAVCSSKADLARAIDVRCDIMTKAVALLADDSSGWSDRLRDANISETSVTHWWSQEQMHVVSYFIEELVAQAPSVLATEEIAHGSSTIVLQHEPYGVCLAMAAWNAVHLLTSRAIITPLLAGNTVILKTSEYTPYTQQQWAELLYAAGLPREVLCVVHVASSDAPSLIPDLVQDKRVRHVNFTGSTRVGAIIAGLAGRSLKPSLMELGGKAPVLLLPDADLQVAASHVLFGTFMNAGQLCMSTERVFVVASRYNELVAALRTAWDTIEHKQSRALFSEASASHVRGLVTDAQTKGAASILEDAQLQKDSASTAPAAIRPMLLGPAGPNMRAYYEESFGPMALIVRVPDSERDEAEVIDEMIRLANDTEYGLTAAVWSRDIAKAKQVASMLECGAVHINSPSNNDIPSVPHGGWKSSGWGRFNGVDGLRSFTQIRSIEIGGEEARPLPLNVFEL